jgi:hypothetical protein
MAKSGIPTEGVALLTAYPKLIQLIEKHLPEGLPEDFEKQLRAVHVPSQILGGLPSSFQFTAYPLPRTTYQERLLLPVSPEKTIEIVGTSWKIAIDINLFGRISRFYVDGIPELFEALRPYLPMD